MKNVQPYLNFPGTTEEAFRFYEIVFDVEIVATIRYREMGGSEMGVPEDDLDRIAHMAIPLGENHMLMATDLLESLGQGHVAGNNYSVLLQTESLEENERLFKRLSDGGRVGMELQRVEWAESFGTCTDRYGIHWMLSFEGDVQYVPPQNA